MDLTKNTTKQLKEQMGAMAGIRGGNQFNDATDAALQEVIRRNRNKAQEMQTDPMNLGPALGRAGQFYEIGRLLLEANNAEKELKFRSGIKLDFTRGGEAAARRNFPGDPLLFDRVFSELVKGQSVAEQSNQTLKNIEDVLIRRNISNQTLKNIEDLLSRRGILTVPMSGSPTGP